jgi:hypothetical protein
MPSNSPSWGAAVEGAVLYVEDGDQEQGTEIARQFKTVEAY